jgi:tRNA A-37 threonylcarbamoyl transferase component Bud32
MIRALALFAILSLTGLPVQAQAVDIDKDGNVKTPEQTQTAEDAAEKIQHIMVPLATQSGGVALPSRMDIPQGNGKTVSLRFVNPLEPRPASRPSSPQDAQFFFWGAIVLAFSVFIWIQARGKLSPAPASTAPAPPPPGAELSSNFAITRVIGQGGMGVVYEATDRTLNRRVAIKKMREEFQTGPVDAERFLKEARTVASLHHPHIVDIYSVVAQGPNVYIVFEFIEGRTVQDILRERGRLSLAEAKFILAPVCQALDYAHERQIIHRDLKPGNVMLGVQGTVKVMDFGISRQVMDKPVVGPNTTGAGTPDQTRTICGTPLYMSPEAGYGLVCRESDVYSLGVMTYEILTGQTPFPQGSLDHKLRRDYPKPSTLGAGLPPAFDGLVDSALNPDYAQRIHSAGEFSARLAAI